MYVIETYTNYIGKETFNGYYLTLYIVNGENYVAIADIDFAKQYKSKKRAENMCEKLSYNNNSNLIYKVMEVSSYVKDKR